MVGQQGGVCRETAGTLFRMLGHTGLSPVKGSGPILRAVIGDTNWRKADLNHFSVQLSFDRGASI